jgi:hypothetical protein
MPRCSTIGCFCFFCFFLGGGGRRVQPGNHFVSCVRARGLLARWKSISNPVDAMSLSLFVTPMSVCFLLLRFVFFWFLCGIEVRSKWNRSDAKLSSKRQFVKTTWHRSDIEVKSKWKRSEIVVTSKWHRSDIEVTSKWNLSEIVVGPINELINWILDCLIN